MAQEKKFIQAAIKRPGALTKRVQAERKKQGKTSTAEASAPADNMGIVRKLAESGSPLAKRQANFFLKVLLPMSKKKKGSSLLNK